MARLHFPYNLDQEIGNKYWRPGENRKLSSNLTPENDVVFSVNTKLMRFGDALTHSEIPVERVDICHQSTDLLEILFYEPLSDLFLEELNSLLSESFCLETRVPC